MDSYTLKSVGDLPAPFRACFNFRYFNSLQSECFPACFHSDENMVVSAPTGSGKTVIFELCILRLLSRFISEDESFKPTNGTLKTIYIAPSKALVQEKVRDWTQKFRSRGIVCLELTGDNESYSTRNLQEADIILTTPEKFDAVTRYRVKDGGLGFFSDIALLLIDEVHLLNDPRGAVLEAIVSRIKMLAHNPEMKSSALAHVRFLAVSATIPNIEDLAEWLTVPVQGIKRFGEEMRPVKLTTKVFGYAPAKNDFLFEKRLQNYIFDILMQYSRGKSALVFCSTRKGAQEAAQVLSQTVMAFGHSNPFIKSREQQERLREASMSCIDKHMQSYMIYGVGYHNGGLCLKDRNLVESLFLKGDLQILCTTNTLAHGINLPAHTVVIKSTQHFNKEKGVYMEIDRSTLLQMCGRAGRPPFDDTGMVVIMTRRDTVHLYENLLNGCEMVESQLLSCLTEHLTAEIVQLTVSDITRAIEWMKCSFLYVRMKKNPAHYAIKKVISNDRIEKHMLEVCVQKINELSRHQMIWTDEDGFLLKPLEPGRLMTKYYLKFDTMKYIIQTPVNCSLEDALHVICRAEEISWIQLRRNEKKLLNDINTDKDGRLRFHILGDRGKRKKRIQTREEKIFLLANDCLTGDPSVHDLSLTQDMNSICSNGCRIARCMKEFFIYQKNYKGALNSMLLAKSMYQKLWDDSPYLLKQLPGIGMVTAKALHSMGVKSFETLAEADPRRIEIVTGRKYPFGNHIKESLLSLPPKVDLKIEETECRGQGKMKLMITLTRLSPTLQSTKRHYADMIVASEEDNLILFHEKIRVDEFSSPYSATVLLQNPQQGKLTVKADLIFEDYIGIDLNQELLFNKESNLSSKNKRGKRASALPLPEEICIIEDDTFESLSKVHEDEIPAKVQNECLPNSTKSKRVDDSMPSFKLLEDDSEEDEDHEVANPVHEDELPAKVQNDAKVVTQQTVFDHIREKAKNFPILVPPNNVFPPSSEPLVLTRKHAREKKLGPESGADVLEELEWNKVPRQTVVNPSSEPKKAEQHLSHVNNHQTPRSSAALNFMDDRGHPSDHLEDGTLKTLTGETIFEHIRTKAKNFPVISKPNVVEAESLIQRKECPYLTDREFSTTAALKGTKPNEVLRDTERDRRLFSVSSRNPSGVLDASSGGIRNGANVASSNMLSFDISMFKNPKRPADLGSTMENARKKHQRSPIVPPRHCSLTAVNKSREVETFLGFESVFSFL
ncbi:DExH-box ATP-dependent RNA helicase DExH17 isoform X1 [Argentina anserina]|uniref:DExH-box ATP-dependent RNA helicase DExH17 isoform X1 n=1 Tax=Argentina anserina TaxID=57926 RepID=UPI00217672FE|nr:DExH-box ATP-dependent RNA helicase DExH17 isoform X1 [Potentilla anserina]